MANKTGDSLTLAQVDELARKLVGTRGNVYHLASSLFGADVGDEIFDRLKDESEIFRCEECSEWHPIAAESPAFTDLCVECRP